jgi:UDP-N-acetylglucosamine/UDP-N-acetylgalactosamine diphosphorylase
MAHFKAAHELQAQMQEARSYLPIREEDTEHFLNLGTLSNDEKKRMEKIGLTAIGNGQVAAVILSGGQGTRLGFNGPKGMYNVGLISGKSIFQLHIERVMKIKELAAKSVGNNSLSIPIYVMTSDLNHEIIMNYFKSQNFFNYPEKDIIFFEQGLEPCFTFDGKMIIENPNSLSLAPDGNGGVYPALLRSGSLQDMTNRGISHIHFYGIDNILTKSLDPVYIGVCIDRGIECGNKVVWRANKSEKVGTTVESGGKMHVVEYSELPAELANSMNEKTNRFLFGAGNICNHLMTLPFLMEKVLPNLNGIYHIANKKISYYDFQEQKQIVPKEPNGVKLEMFIFDIFPFADKWIVIETERTDEFAPVKNEPGNPADSPDTARALISLQAVRWLQAAGAQLSSTDFTYTMLPTNSELQCEISPLLSYAGEGLESYRGKEVNLPAHLH